MSEIKFYVENQNGDREEVMAPTDMSLNLMEVLKGHDYPVMATCGGIALCATCHVEVIEGIAELDECEDAELDMLDTLPELTDNSRLACQIPITDALDGMVLRILAEPATS